jgi:hypothetical protein
MGRSHPQAAKPIRGWKGSIRPKSPQLVKLFLGNNKVVFSFYLNFQIGGLAERPLGMALRGFVA